MTIKYFEEEYNTQKMIFLIENPYKTERNFIESKFEQFNQLELEYKRKCNLSDDEVYQEIKKTGIVVNNIGRGFDKTDKKDFEADLENRFLKFRERYIFKEKKEDNLRLTFYKTKLKNLQVPEPKPRKNEPENSLKWNGIIKAKDYISLIVNSYFDAQESLGNDPELIDLVKNLFKQTLLRVGKKQEQENCMTTDEFNSRVYFALEAMKDCGYYDGWEVINNTEFMRIETIIKDIERPISRIEFKNIADWIDDLTNVPQQPEPEKIFSNIGFEFKNNFDNVNETTVFNYFKKNLVDTKHISETDLNLFLNLAFDKMEVPKQKFSFEYLKTQKGIIKYFYNYYKVVAGKPYGKQPKYLNLLCVYFNGFDYDKIKTNFAN